MVRIGIYVSLILLCSLATSAQSGSHKTYSGRFSKGEATYTYVEAPDGTRIFDGKFTYRQGECTLTGQFKNDLQSGSWTFTDNSGNLFVKTLVKKTCSFAFDDNGLLSGPVSSKVYFKNGTVIETESYNLDEGREEGEYKYVDWEDRKSTITGQYHEGKRVGIWRHTSANDEPVLVNYDITKSGNPQVTTIDRTTGDKIIYYSSIYYQSSGEENGYFSGISGVGILYRKSDCDIEYKETSHRTFSQAVREHTTLTSETYDPKAIVKLRCIIEKDGTISSICVLTGFNETVDADAIQLVPYLGLEPSTRLNRFNEREPVRTVVRFELSYPLIEDTFWEKDVKSDEVDEPAVFVDAPDKKPEFPGGKVALDRYVSNHIRYPSYASENGIQGAVTVRFEVLANGCVGNVEIVRGKHASLDKEALRIIKSLPRFTPAEANGKPVATHCEHTVTFRLN